MTELSFSSLMSQIDFVAAYTQAVQIGNAKFLSFLPQYWRQTVATIAQQKLHNTALTYISALDIDLKEDTLIVMIDEKNWLATSLEVGVKGWPMVKTHLNGPKTKGPPGARYKIIPLKPQKNVPMASTDKGQYFFDKIRAVLQKPKMGAKTQVVNPDATVTVTQPYLTTVPEAQGMFRVQQYQSTQALLTGKRPISSKNVLFRTISEKHPEKWQHPGLQARHILKDAEQIVNQDADAKWKTFVDVELAKLGGS